jgi:hypothetical protein
MVSQRKAGGYKHIPPPGVGRNLGPLLDRPFDHIGQGGELLTVINTPIRDIICTI